MKKTALLALIVAVTTALAAGGATAPTPAGPITTRTLTLDLAGVPSRAELLLPAGTTRAPLVLLVQGTGPEDMNGSFVTLNGVMPGSMGRLAMHLAGQGFAVMRFDKRYAAQTFNPASSQAAQANYARLTMRDLLADARTALKAATAQGGTDARRVYLYGWSEGSVIAANLALEVGAQGLIVQGPVVDSFVSTFTNQFARVGIPYLSTYATDGQLDLAGLMRSFQGPGSLLAKMQGQLLFALDSTPQQPKLNSVLDSNKDGRIDLRLEALPMLQALYPQLTAQNPKYAAATTLPTLGELRPQWPLPLLILQGENDGNIDPASARKLHEAWKGSTLKLYPGLGHTLGKASNVTQDEFPPMESAPMNDIAAWLRAH